MTNKLLGHEKTLLHFGEELVTHSIAIIRFALHTHSQKKLQRNLHYPSCCSIGSYNCYIYQHIVTRIINPSNSLLQTLLRVNKKKFSSWRQDKLLVVWFTRGTGFESR